MASGCEQRYSCNMRPPPPGFVSGRSRVAPDAETTSLRLGGRGVLLLGLGQGVATGLRQVGFVRLHALLDLAASGPHAGAELLNIRMTGLAHLRGRCRSLLRERTDAEQAETAQRYRPAFHCSILHFV